MPPQSHATTVLAVLASIILIWNKNFSLPLIPDEIQYLSAAALIDTHAIYTDFLYSQTPYFPAVLAGWLSISESFGLSVYEAARLLNALLSCGVVAAFAVLATRVSGYALVATLLVVALPLSSYVGMPLRFVRNDTLPLLLFLLALLAVTEALRRPDPQGWLYALAGLAMGVATMAKQSYAFPSLALFVFAVFFAAPGWRTRVIGAALPLGLGGLVGGAPGFLVILPRWEFFYFDAVTFHRTAHLDWILPGRDDWPLKWQLGIIRRSLADPAMIALCMAAMALAAVLGPRRMWSLASTDSFERRVLLLSILLGASLGASFLLAAPMHPMYAAPLFPLMALVVAVLARARVPAAEPARGLHRIAVPGLAALAIAGGAGLQYVVPVPGHTVNGFMLRAAAIDRVDGEAFPAIAALIAKNGAVIRGDALALRPNLARIREEMQGALDPQTEPGAIRVATLQGAVALEAGFAIYPVFASAPFFYRSNMIYSDETLKRMNGTSPDQVADWLTRNDVRALLVTDDRQLQEGFLAYARDTGMTCRQIDLSGVAHAHHGEFYLDPALAGDGQSCTPRPAPAPMGVAGMR